MALQESPTDRKKRQEHNLGVTEATRREVSMFCRPWVLFTPWVGRKMRLLGEIIHIPVSQHSSFCAF